MTKLTIDAPYPPTTTQNPALAYGFDKMSKLITANPYSANAMQYSAWVDGFEAGQKSTLTPVSVTGRWWQSKNKEIFFIYKNQYVIYERITENNPDNSRWLTDEETREFE